MAWSVLQSAGNPSATLTATATLATNLSSGSKLVAYVSNAAAMTISTVKDTAGNSFSQVASNIVGAITDAHYIYVLDTPAGDVGAATTITATWTGTANGAAILVQEVSGLAAGSTAAACLDGTPAKTSGSGVLASGGTSLALGAYASAAASEYLIILYADDGDTSGSTGTLPTGYTADTHNVSSSSSDDLRVYFKNSTGGTEAPTTITVAGGGQSFGWTATFVAFKLAATASAASAASPAVPGPAWRARFHHGRFGKPQVERFAPSPAAPVFFIPVMRAVTQPPPWVARPPGFTRVPSAPAAAPVFFVSWTRAVQAPAPAVPRAHGFAQVQPPKPWTLIWTLPRRPAAVRPKRAWVPLVIPPRAIALPVLSVRGPPRRFRPRPAFTPPPPQQHPAVPVTRAARVVAPAPRQPQAFTRVPFVPAAAATPVVVPWTQRRAQVRAARPRPAFTLGVLSGGGAFTIFGQPSGITTNTSSGDYSLSMQFSLSSPQPLTGVWFYSPPGATVLPDSCVIFNAGGTQVSGTLNTSPAWSGAAGSGWIRCAYPGTTTLSAGVNYFVTIGHSGVFQFTTGYWTTGGPGAAGITSGPLFAPNFTSSLIGQDPYAFSSNPPLFPNQIDASAATYWVDVQVGSGALPAVTTAVVTPWVQRRAVTRVTRQPGAFARVPFIPAAAVAPAVVIPWVQRRAAVRAARPRTGFTQPPVQQHPVVLVTRAAQAPRPHAARIRGFTQPPVQQHPVVPAVSARGLRARPAAAQGFARVPFIPAVPAVPVTRAVRAVTAPRRPRGLPGAVKPPAAAVVTAIAVPWTQRRPQPPKVRAGHYTGPVTQGAARPAPPAWLGQQTRGVRRPVSRLRRAQGFAAAFKPAAVVTVPVLVPWTVTRPPVAARRQPGRFALVPAARPLIVPVTRAVQAAKPRAARVQAFARVAVAAAVPVITARAVRAVRAARQLRRGPGFTSVNPQITVFVPPVIKVTVSAAATTPAVKTVTPLVHVTSVASTLPKAQASPSGPAVSAAATTPAAKVS